MRTFFIWVFGLLGSGSLGAILGLFANHQTREGGSVIGFFGGMAAFVCLRLWLGGPTTK